MTSGAGVLVTGTDTGVGKTAVACGIIANLVRQGMRVAPLKPVETGHAGGAWPSDAACLAEAAGVLSSASARNPARPSQALDGAPGAQRHDAHASAVVPYVFDEPLAPAVAARRAGVTIDAARLDAALGRCRAQGFAVVEGAGGLMVPMTDGLDVAGLAARWDLPVLVVARPDLGTINHTCLTVAHARARGLHVLGVVVNGMPATPDAAQATNPAEIARLANVPVLGVVPRMVGVDTGARRWRPMAQAVRAHVDLAPLVALAGDAHLASPAWPAQRKPS